MRKNKIGMKRSAKEKIIVLSASFVLFVVGVLALSMDRGNGRTIVLVCVIVAMAAIAGRQTIQNHRKKE